MSEVPATTYEGPEVRLVRMTPSLMEALCEAAAGRGNLIEWGEPDEDGFYTPTITLLNDVVPIP